MFEGSCNLIPVKIIAEECVKLADDFIPQLVETLSSEMNPQLVCATAGRSGRWKTFRDFYFMYVFQACAIQLEWTSSWPNTTHRTLEPSVTSASPSRPSWPRS